ncbi:MAG: DJ-1/PfpI family protein [Xanthobacteraceae bacterium]
MSVNSLRCQMGLLLFAGMTQIDFAEPYEVFARLPETIVHVVAKSLDPVCTERGLVIVPTISVENCPKLDVVVVPGGPGIAQLLEDEAMLAFLRRQAREARYVTSVCTGSLVLGAAGLLDGRRATTHWLSMPLLPLFGAIAVNERVVVDGNTVTGGGCTSGMDFALQLAAMMRGETIAKQIQLQLEYSPAPPFAAGSPATAPKEIVETVRGAAARLLEERRQICEQAARRLHAPA